MGDNYSSLTEYTELFNKYKRELLINGDSALLHVLFKHKVLANFIDNKIQFGTDARWFKSLFNAFSWERTNTPKHWLKMWIEEEKERDRYNDFIISLKVKARSKKKPLTLKQIILNEMPHKLIKDAIKCELLFEFTVTVQNYIKDTVRPDIIDACLYREDMHYIIIEFIHDILRNKKFVGDCWLTTFEYCC